MQPRAARYMFCNHRGTADNTCNIAPRTSSAGGGDQNTDDGMALAGGFYDDAERRRKGKRTRPWTSLVGDSKAKTGKLCFSGISSGSDEDEDDGQDASDEDWDEVTVTVHEVGFHCARLHPTEYPASRGTEVCLGSVTSSSCGHLDTFVHTATRVCESLPLSFRQGRVSCRLSRVLCEGHDTILALVATFTNASKVVTCVRQSRTFMSLS